MCGVPVRGKPLSGPSLWCLLAASPLNAGQQPGAQDLRAEIAGGYPSGSTQGQPVADPILNLGLLTGLSGLRSRNRARHAQGQQPSGAALVAYRTWYPCCPYAWLQHHEAKQMNDLHKAYLALGLEPGSPLSTVIRRYRRLCMVWHPDLAPNEDQRQFREEELKKYNNAKDLIEQHHSSGAHKETGCECQLSPDQESSAQAAGQRAQWRPGPGQGSRSKASGDPKQEEEAARRRNEERERREREEAAARQREQQAQQASQRAMDNAVHDQQSLRSDKMRWQISAGIIIAFLAILIPRLGHERAQASFA
jgi:hypothetical protein